MLPHPALRRQAGALNPAQCDANAADIQVREWLHRAKSWPGSREPKACTFPSTCSISSSLPSTRASTSSSPVPRAPARRPSPTSPSEVARRAMLCTGLPADHGDDRVDDLRDDRWLPADAGRSHLPPRSVRRGHRVGPLARDRRAEPLELRPCLRPALHRAVGCSRSCCRSSATARTGRCRSCPRASSRPRTPTSIRVPRELANHRHDERLRQEPALRDVLRAHAALRVHRGRRAERRGVSTTADGPGGDRAPSCCRCAT